MLFKLPLIVISLVSFAAGLSHRLPLDKRQTPTNGSTTVRSYNATIPVDHFNESDTKTYLNRYFINDEYYRPGGPVVLYDPGEGGIDEQYIVQYLTGSNGLRSAANEVAKRFNGLAIAWEHRYYGFSQPVPIVSLNDPDASFETAGLPTEGAQGYKYLTAEQALEDVVYFANNFHPDGYNDSLADALHPSNTPWIWVGGSYSGARGAWMRLRNPEIIYAVWASSAAVEMRYDASVYFNPIYKGLPKNCSSDIHAVVQYVDGILSSTQQGLINATKGIISWTASSVNNPGRSLNASTLNAISNFGVGNLLVDPILNYFQPYGPPTFNMFCDLMQSFDPDSAPDALSASQVANVNLTAYINDVVTNPGNNTPQDSSMTSRYGPATALNAYLYAYLAFQNELSERVLGNSSNNVARPRSPTVLQDIRSWQAQQLLEFGLAQGTQSGKSYNLVSKYFTYPLVRQDRINTWFPSIDPDFWPNPPVVDNVLRYGGWDMQPSNVMFTNGEFDPWRSISVASEEDTIFAPMRNATQGIPECGLPPNGTDYFGVIYPGQVHVSDMSDPHPDWPEAAIPLNTGFGLFSRALEEWLPCFG